MSFQQVRGIRRPSSVLLFLVALILTGCEFGTDTGSAYAPITKDPVMGELEDILARDSSDEEEVTRKSLNKGAWSQSGKLVTGDPSRQVQCGPVQFESPGVYTVGFGVDLPNFPTAVLVDPTTLSPAVLTQALITWSVAGNRFQRLISIASGTTIQGDAEGVQVTVFDNTLPGSSRQLIGLEYNVVILVTKGTRAPTANPPMLAQTEDDVTVGRIPIVTATPGVTVPIPKNVGINAFQVLMAQNGDLSVTQQFEYGGAAPVNLTSMGIPSQPAVTNPIDVWIPIVPGANQLTFVGTHNPFSFILLWGVDG